MRLYLSAVRVVSWNTANGPDNATEDAWFRTVFAAIGAEAVGGRTLPPAIVALQETDTAAFGGNSIARVDAILESLYPTRNYRTAASPLDTGDDANGFVFDSGIFDLVDTHVVDELGSMQAFAHNILRGQFRPIGTGGSQDFFIYSTHLKAGSNGGDASRRANEAAAIRADIDALGPNQDVLVVGDFNISGSSEQAYRNFLSSGNGQLFDPIDTPGDWKNNPAFVGIHTQNPAINGPGGMDDRFDFQLATAAVFDDERLQYLEDTYRAFGNNGTHRFNSDITTGTGATPNVLTALAAASDHLPVIADYEIELELAGITLEANDPLVTLIEGQSGDAYSIMLNTVPDADVDITITTDGQTLVSGSTSTTITFTPDDALIPKFLTVTAIADGIGEGDHFGTLTHTLTSTDAGYAGLIPNILQVPIRDVDRPSVVISEMMYNPNSAEPDGEWVEIVNLGPGHVDISGWWLDDEDTLDWGAIPQATPPLAPGEVAVIHNAVIDSAVFRDRWAVPDDAQVIGVLWGSLANGPSAGNEMLELRDATGGQQDNVNYDDEAPWPDDNGDSSIYLADVRSDNQIGQNWSASVFGVDGARRPSGSPFSPSDIGSPGDVPHLDFSPPRLIAIGFDDNSMEPSQRSMLRSVTLQFDSVVSLNAAAFDIIRNDVSATDVPEIAVQTAVTNINDRTEVRLTFDGDQVDPQTGSLIDGDYVLTVLANQVIDADGVALDGDDDGQAGGNVVIGDAQADRFFRLFGDLDGDRSVGVQDLSRFVQRLSGSRSPGSDDAVLDHDGDGDVDSRDLGQARRQLFGQL